MYAMLLARFKMFPEVKEKGMSSVPKLVAFTSEHVRTQTNTLFLQSLNQMSDFTAQFSSSPHLSYKANAQHRYTSGLKLTLCLANRRSQAAESICHFTRHPPSSLKGVLNDAVSAAAIKWHTNMSSQVSFHRFILPPVIQVLLLCFCHLTEPFFHQKRSGGAWHWDWKRDLHQGRRMVKCI